MQPTTCRFILLLALLYVAFPNHLPGAVIYVKATASGAATNGLSWETAFRKIQNGINAAAPGDELWVAAGTYPEHLTLKEGVKLFGGFDGIETHPSQRNWNIHKSIIDGSGSGRVISVDVSLEQGTRVDGFVIKNGSNDFGGGVYSAGGNLIFDNNLVVANRANGPFSGAGIFVDESATFPPQPLHTLFTTISDRLLSEHSPDLSSSHIPLFPTNRYTPEVHRLLQVAANIVDATTNRGASYPYYPSVFRPVFTNDNGAIAISGYVEADDAQFISNTWLDLKISQDRSLLTSDEVRSNANLYGQPIIIGAKKGFPNFNEFSMETVAQVIRRVELRKAHPLLPPNETNQMFLLGITNVFGVEAWNSYTNDFTRPIELHVRHITSATLTNHLGLRLLQKTTTTSPAPMLITNWSAVKIGTSLSPFAFKLPLHGSLSALPQSQYIAVPSQFQLATNTSFERNVGFAIPTWVLTLTNRLQYFTVDNDRVVDFVNVDGLNVQIDLTRELFSAPNNSYPPYEEPLMAALWSTNRANNSLPTQGILNQINFSLGEIAPGNFWRDYTIARQDISIEKQIDEFRFFMGLSPIYGNTNMTPTNRMQVPFSPIRTIYQKATWQANDPFVHHQVHDLVAGNSPTLRMVIPPVKSYGEFSESNLGRLNERLNPYFLKPYSSYSTNNPFGRNGNYIRDGALQDINIRWPQDWDFPNHPTFNLAWLDRVHRGTPWQTLFTGDSHHSTSDWQKWSGSAETHPTNDWSIIHNLLTNKSALGATVVSEWTPGLVNNTFAQNISPFRGAGVTIFSPAHFVNNIVANNDSGVAVLGVTPELSPGKNLVAANRSDDLTGISPGAWNIAEYPQFVSAGNFHLRATSPAIDAGAEEVFTNGLLLNEPARVQGARLDLGAYELSATDAPVLTFTSSAQNPELHSLRVIGFTGEAYVVEQSTDLANWTPVFTNNTANGSFEHLDPLTNPHLFYRAVHLPR